MLDSQSVVVFVTDPSDCLCLLHRGKQLACRLEQRLQIISLQQNCELTALATKQLQNLYNCTQNLGGEMSILFSREPALTAAVTAKKLGVSHILSGQMKRAFIRNVRLLLPDIPWTVVNPDGTEKAYSPLVSTTL